MVCPQGGLDHAGSNGCDADTKEIVEFGHGAHEAADAVFCGRVYGGGEGCVLSGDTGNVGNVFGLLGVAVT